LNFNISKIKKSALFKDSFWALSGNVFGKGLALVASVCIARLLGRDVFGMYGLIRTVLLSIAVFSTFGLGYTATKFIAEYTKNHLQKVRAIISNIMQITLVTGSLFAILLFVFSKQIANYLGAADLYNAIRYLAVIVIFNSITTTQVGMLAGFKKFKVIARINLINGIFMLVCSVGLTYFYGLNGALLALLMAQILNCLQNYLEVRKSIQKLNVSDDNTKYSIKRELVTFSFPVALQEMLYSILTWVTPVLLVKFSNFGEVGMYNAAQQWSSVILFIPGTLRNVILSHVSADADNHKQQIKTLHRMLLINFLATFIPFVVVFLFSGFIENLYGNTFTSLKIVLNISVCNTIFMTLSNVFKQYFMAINQNWIMLWVRIGSIISLFTLFIIISKITNDGNSSLHMASSSIIIHIIFFVILYFLYRHYERKSKYVHQNYNNKI
jgi:O-antigen/teichoic acid export membrane protein